MSFDWDDLKYFLAVARTGKLTGAARQIGTDHSTVSRRISALESKLGTILFQRSPRGYALNEAGERLLTYAERMEGEADSAQEEIAGGKVTVSGAVRVGAPDGFGAFFLATQLGDLVERFPQLDIELVAMPRIFSLSKREADIAISLARPEKGRLFSRKLTDYTLHIYGARSYLERTPAIMRKQDLAAHSLIGYIQDLIFTPELDYLTQIGMTASPRLSSTNLLAQMRAAEAGYGLCVLPDFMARERENLVAVLPEQVELTRSFWIIAHLDSRDLARIRTVINFISERVSHRLSSFYRPTVR